MKVGKWSCLFYIFIFGLMGERIGIVSENFLNNQLIYVICCSISGVLTFLASYLLYLLYKNVTFISKDNN